MSDDKAKRGGKRMASGGEALVGARAPVELRPLTDQQREYLQRMLDSSGKFDPDIKVGGPNLGFVSFE